MRDDLLNEVTKRLQADYRLEKKGDWLRLGKCPQCSKKELYAKAASPWMLKCGRLDRCGWEGHVKELYPEIFDDWSKRYKSTPANPTAAADAYLSHARGFDLQGLRGAYSQEYYRDEQLRIGSATVRFPLPGGGWWERLIDQPARFGKMKARFSYGVGYRGRWWQLPNVTLEEMARASEIWICEGIFDAIALRSAGIIAVSAMSSNNYPELALAELRQAVAAIEPAIKGPKLIWAFDVGKAGVEYTRKFVDRARKEGWECGAAQVRMDGDGDKLDWNDLAQRDRLTPELLDEYRWNGDVTIAETASEKAYLIYKRHKSSAFPLVFRSRQLWAEFSLARIEEVIEAYGADPQLKDRPYQEKFDMAAREAVEVAEIANCAFRALYFQHDEATDDSCYYFRIDFPKRAAVKGTFSGSALAAGAEFKKRLISIAPGGIWTGTTYQLDRLMQKQLATIKSVEAIQFTGYSIDHSAYVFGDIGVHKGRVFDRNAEDYFDFGKHSVKLRSNERLLRIVYDADKLNTAWVDDILTAFGAKGIVTLAFWFMSLFAEQIRREQESLAFLEITGPPGTGKTTLIAFLWKLLGRVGNYEGFDPAKATAAAIARNLGKVSNMPVVLIEGDRGQDSPHGRRFEWDELKTAYNGRSVRARGVANGGMETFEPPFRGAVAIVQNDTVEASPAMRERIMGVHFDKTGWNDDTKVAAERLARIDMDEVSGFIIHAVRREAEIMERYLKRFAEIEKQMLADPQVRNGRLAKNHAQLAAMLDTMTLVIPNIARQDIAEAHRLIGSMLRERQLAVNMDHPHVELFWERFDWIEGQLVTANSGNGVNHSRDPSLIAVNLVQFEKLCGDFRLSLPPMGELKRLLKSSKSRKFIGAKPVNSAVLERTIHCWCFERPRHS